MKSANLTFHELARAAWRWRWWFLVPVVLGVAGAFAALQVMPKVYRASTLVMVEPQKVPSDYVKATVTTTMGERLKTIEQQITNRSNLERIVREMNLYPEVRGVVGMDELVQQARRDLSLQVKGDTIFQIFFKGGDPEKIAATANRIAELFIAENLKLRADQAGGTSQFLERELAETKARLEIQEAKIAQFKQLYMGQLPEQRETNLRAVEQLQTKLEINMDAEDKAEQRRLFVQRDIVQWQPVAPSLAVPAAPGAPSRLQVVRGELADLLTRYTERHPDVVRKRSEIALLEKQQQEERSAIEVGDAPELPAARPANPVLRAQLDAIDLEIRGLRSERERILAEISQLQGRIEATPRVEQGLLSLTRDYDNIRASYESLLTKRIEARLAENLEKTRQSEQFTILEKAIPPARPVAPDPLLWLGGGLLAGVAAGLALALLREQTDHTYTDAESFQQAFPAVPVLATIPTVGGPRRAAYVDKSRGLRKSAAGGRNG